MLDVSKLSTILNASPTVEDNIKRYLTNYAGRGFDTFGAYRFDPFHVTGDDIVAVTMLSMGVNLKGRRGQMSTPAAIKLDSPKVSKQISELLHSIPIDRDLYELDDADFTRIIGSPRDSSASQQLWKTIDAVLSDSYPTEWQEKSYAQNHGVFTAKIIARKRPRLFPIIDSHNRKILGSTLSWKDWHTTLRNDMENDGALITTLKCLRSTVPEAASLALLRIADIAVWMTEE